METPHHYHTTPAAPANAAMEENLDRFKSIKSHEFDLKPREAIAPKAIRARSFETDVLLSLFDCLPAGFALVAVPVGFVEFIGSDRFEKLIEERQKRAEESQEQIRAQRASMPTFQEYYDRRMNGQVPATEDSQEFQSIWQRPRRETPQEEHDRTEAEARARMEARFEKKWGMFRYRDSSESNIYPVSMSKQVIDYIRADDPKEFLPDPGVEVNRKVPQPLTDALQQRRHQTFEEYPRK